MPAKRKTLPKHFDLMLRSGSPDGLRAVFNVCQVDARGGLTKQVALAFQDCPDDLSRWLVATGADLAAEDAYGETPAPCAIRMLARSDRDPAGAGR